MATRKRKTDPAKTPAESTDPAVNGAPVEVVTASVEAVIEPVEVATVEVVTESVEVVTAKAARGSRTPTLLDLIRDAQNG